MRIVIFSNIPSPYFVEYLNELGKMADVYAVFERKKANDRDSSWEIVNANNFTYSFLKGIKIGAEASLSFGVKKIIKNNINGIVIFANPTTPTGIIGIKYCKRKGIKYCLQSEGGLPKNGKGFKEKFKKKLLSGATLYLTGMKPETDYFGFYGAPISKIRQYPFASLHESDLITRPLTIQEKEKIKKDLGINSEKVILYVGRMIECKGVDVLLKAFNKQPSNVSLYCVGGEPTSEFISIIEGSQNKNIYFVNHTNLDNLKKYYLTADVFVLPTRGDTWGLVINEAMSYGLPVITTNMCVAGNQLIENGINGYIVPVDSPDEIDEAIRKISCNNGIVKYAENNIKKISSYTYENMAKTIYRHLSELIKN